MKNTIKHEECKDGKDVVREQNQRILELIKLIKGKKELSRLDNTYVEEKLHPHLTKKILNKLFSAKNIQQFTRSKEYTTLRQAIRKQLRETYGVFDTEDVQNKHMMLEKLKNNSLDETIIRSLLAVHQSTKERIPYYSTFYKEIIQQTAMNTIRDVKILDVGCGLNPVSYPFLFKELEKHFEKIIEEKKEKTIVNNLRKNNATKNIREKVQSNTAQKINFVCSDISQEDMSFLTDYFSFTNINGLTKVVDATKIDDVLAIVKKEKPTIILLLKVLDTFESIKRHCTKKLLATIGEYTNFFVVSFATVSLSGGKIIHENRRAWFEKYLSRMKEKEHWSWTTFSLPNEKVYVITTKVTI